mmetsp:Transcript_10009/g.37351  ORF Transcript_10009/g.37351 Transcript_10009/m.37351 type:complete len:456 (-) Transcript_10009:3952-5319(-)
MCFAPPVIQPLRIISPAYQRGSPQQNAQSYSATQQPFSGQQFVRNPYQHPAAVGGVSNAVGQQQPPQHVYHGAPVQQQVPIVSAYHAGYAFVNAQPSSQATPALNALPVNSNGGHSYQYTQSYQQFYGGSIAAYHRAQEELRAITIGGMMHKHKKQHDQEHLRNAPPRAVINHKNVRRQKHKYNRAPPTCSNATQKDIRTTIEFGKAKKPTTIIPCKFFMKNNRCKYGSSCRFSHVHCWPMPSTFSEDKEAQEYVKQAVKDIKKREAEKQNKQELKEGTASPAPDLQSEELSTKDTTPTTTSDSEVATIHYETLTLKKTAPASTRNLSSTTQQPKSRQVGRSPDFEWKKALQADSGLVYREAVHYSSESADAPRSKMCNTILQILKGSEEYQRIEMICNREEKKHNGQILFRPAFVDGKIEIQVSVTEHYESGPVNMPMCMDGIGIKLIKVLNTK